MPAGRSCRPLTSQAGGCAGLSVRHTPVHRGFRIVVQSQPFCIVSAQMSARAVVRRSGPASCCKWASARRSETIACRRARLRATALVASCDSIFRNETSVMITTSINAMMVNESTSEKPRRTGALEVTMGCGEPMRGTGWG